MSLFSPLTQKKIKSFKSIKRGYWSFIILTTIFALSLIAEVFINSKALVVKYDNDYYFPVLTGAYMSDTFGLDTPGETNYRNLQKKFEAENSDNFVIMPIVPYNPYEQIFDEEMGVNPPYAPNAEKQHYLGTDILGRDILARLVYGFRIALSFALLTLFACYSIGVAVGCMMGYFGGLFDLGMQRIIEVWSMVPFLYVIMIIVSIFQPTFTVFVIVNVIFGWTGMTWYMRSMTYKEATRDYVLAAKALGASNTRIIFKHILPNIMVMIVTFAPFAIAGNITALTALDYLGLGLLPPTPSWGELLQQGKSNLGSPWIVWSVVTALVLVLVMVTFIGEAIRAAFDPKKFMHYE